MLGAIEYITLPKNLKSLSDGVFTDCDQLTTVEIPEGLTTIGFYAFSGCDKLDSIHVPKSVVSIGRGILEGCGKAVININYDGTAAEWEAIEKNKDWAEKTLNVTVNCIGGTITVTPEITQ